MKLFCEILYIGQKDGYLHTFDHQGHLDEILWLKEAKDIYDMIILDVNSCLLATEKGLYEIHDGKLAQTHLVGIKIKAIAMLAEKSVIIGIRDGSLMQYNLKTCVETLFTHGSFISMMRLTESSFLVKSFESLLLVNNLSTYNLAAIKDQK
jgi:hypothetical protein